MANEWAARKDPIGVVEDVGRRRLIEGEPLWVAITQSPALRHFPLQLSPVQQLAARGDILLTEFPEFLAQRCNRRLRRVAVLPADGFVDLLRPAFIVT